MIKLYINLKMFRMLCFGFASGFPALLVFSTLGMWLKDAGMSLGVIGAFALVKIPYAFKWLFSPFVDNVKIPFIYKLGRRRSWGLMLQVFLMFAILAMASIAPDKNIYVFALFTFLSALISACLDVVLDAYRVESFDDETQGSGAAVFVLGYRLGYVLSGAGALFMATLLPWELVYTLFSFVVMLGIVVILFAKEPEIKFKKDKDAFFVRSLITPIKDFFSNKNAFYILIFIAIYRLPETFVQSMILPFLDDLGFLKTEIAKIYNLYGIIATIVGGFFGGYFVLRIGILKGLVYLGVLQGLTNVLYIYQNYVGLDINSLAFCVCFDNIVSGMGTTAFIAYISSLCNKQYTATQYALLTSLFALFRDVFSGFSGVFANYLGWNMFFGTSALLAIPGIVLIFYLRDKKSS